MPLSPASWPAEDVPNFYFVVFETFHIISPTFLSRLNILNPNSNEAEYFDIF